MDKIISLIMLEISIIVTAYNRTQYLDQALTSLANQSFQKDNFEIIVITNFQYRFADNNLKIKYIIMEGTIGNYLSTGIKASNGNIICFLDDDDLFHVDKLTLLNKLFKDSDAIYFKNGVSKFSQDRKSANDELIGSVHRIEVKNMKSILNSSLEFNLSSISVKRQFIIKYLDKINNIKSATDTFMFLIFVNEQGIAIMYDANLTYYRVHNSTSNFMDENPINRNYINWAMDMMNNYNFMYNAFQNEMILRFIEIRRAVFKARIFIYNKPTSTNFTNNDMIKLFFLAFVYRKFTIYYKMLLFGVFILKFLPGLFSIFEIINKKVENLYRF